MSFKYLMPTKCYFGKGAVLEHKDELKNFGKKAMIVTGKRSSKKNGSLKDMEEALISNGINYVIFDDIEENPSLETIGKASELGKEEKVDFIIGIGGGSPIDASKAIGVLINNKDYSYENILAAPPLKGIPVIAVPTTAGTGSEVTPYSIVTDHKAKTKKNLGQLIYPEIAFCDASYMIDMSYDVTVNTGIDAFSHLAESYLNSNANIMSDIYCEKGLKIFRQCLSKLLTGELDLKLREDLMMVSTLGGIAITQTGTSLPHGMGYHLTYFKGMAHGMANGILYEEYLKVFKDKTRVNELLSFIGVGSIEELGEKLRSILKWNGTVTKEELLSYAKSIASNKGKLKNHPEEITEKELYNIYYRSLIR